ncbi:hypothetical protein ACIBO5_08725 [Nonomuraea angiospora]|uniref:hypothetical protein n=1 Tax=Nonomuraea angiospora TaxID=46172 RepID=UPI00378B96CC
MTAVPDEGWLVSHPPPRRARLFALPVTTDGYTLDDWLKLPETKAGNVLSLDQPFPLSFDPAVLTGPRSTTQG